MSHVRGIQVFHANQVERLTAQFALDLATYRAETGIWEAPCIVVPNPSVRDYLRQSIAEIHGIAANLGFHYLDAFWRRYAEPDCRLLDRATLEGLLLSLLEDPTEMAQEALAPVQVYLQGEPTGLKRLQLAQRLARLFEAYALGRPDWMADWLQSRSASTQAPGALERWQGRLWRDLRRLLRAARPRWLTLAEWAEDPSFSVAPWPSTVFCFGLSHMAQAYHRAFVKLGEQSAVRLYVLSPCRETWDFSPRRATLEDEDPFGLLEDRAHVLLQRWARAGRENLRLLGEVAQGDLVDGSTMPEDTGLLASLQARILDASCVPDNTEADPSHPSLAVLACASPRREAEAVASWIWERVLHDQGQLRFSDVAVLVPPSSRALYLDHLRVAFSETHRIPWILADAAPGGFEELARAATLLLELPLGDLSRAEMLRVLGHPGLQARWGDVNLASWATCCARAGIVARLDASETSETWLEGGRWTWEEGFARLALGTFMEEDALLDLDGRVLRPVATPEAPAMIHRLGTLLKDLRELGAGKHTPGTWMLLLRRFLEKHLLSESEDSGKAASSDFPRLLKALDRISKLEVPGVVAPELDYRCAARLAIDALLEAGNREPGQIGRGVMVSSYAPMRLLPFKVMLLLGLGEGCFPGQDAREPMDLRSYGPRRAGDVSQGEQDRFLFLETLLNARGHVLMSYVDRDPITGERLQPSPLLQDLAEALAIPISELQHRPPVHRHDPAYFPDLHSTPLSPPLVPCHNPVARSEGEVHFLGTKLRSYAGGRDLSLRIGDWHAPDGLTAELESRLDDCGPIAGRALGEVVQVRHVTLTQLRQWLECPVQGGARILLGIREEREDDVFDVDEEPLATSPMDRHPRLRQAFWTSVVTGTSLADACHGVCSELADRALAPTGIVGEMEARQHLACLEHWRSLLTEDATPCRHRFGTAFTLPDEVLPVVDHPSLRFEIRHGEQSVEIVLEGLTEPMDGATTLLLSTEPAPQDKKAPSIKDSRALLRAWLDHLMLAASGLHEGVHRALVLSATKDKACAWSLAFPAVDQSAAQTILQGWLQDIFSEQPPKLLPIEAVLAGKEIEDLASWIDEQDKLCCFRGPVRDVKGLPVQEGWRDVARRRFHGFTEMLNTREPG